MDQKTPQLRAIFEEALDLPCGPERFAFVSRVCGPDTALRERVLQLLSTHESAGGFMPAMPRTGLTESDPEGAVGAGVDPSGTVVGLYTLRKVIGEGGFGIVYLAEQEEPVQREVALKIIKPGMDTRQVLARFETERRALERVDHPNIARVLDAGTTDQGRPYFVMERVDGLPMTKFCARYQLKIRERLELFIQVCQAVQHAHLKGILHRDLKPTNVLVARGQGTAIAKVIDFGVAKAIHERLSDSSYVTLQGQMLGTPAYMSPEQADRSGVDVDTRTDVYSLGALLYELLTGSTPFPEERLRTASYAELERILKEEEPPNPSSRLAASTARQNRPYPAETGSATSHAAQASHELEGPTETPEALRDPFLPEGETIPADLDWVVMKCLEKDRSRRYETVHDLAADLRRFLSDEPVTAMPPTAVYRFQKFFRRHRTLATACALALAALVVGFGLSVVGFIKADRANTRAEAEAREAKNQAATAQAVLAILENDLIPQADPYSASADFEPDRNLTLRAALEQLAERIESRLEGRPMVEASIRLTLGRTFLRLGETEKAEPQIRRAEALYAELEGPKSGRTLEVRHLLALTLDQQGQTEEAIAMHREVLRLRQAVLGPHHSETYESRIELARALAKDPANFEEAERLLKRVIHELERRTESDEPTDLLAKAMTALSSVYWNSARWDEHDRLREVVFALRKQQLGINHPSVLWAAADRVYDLQNRFGDLRAAEELHQQVYQASEKALGVRDGATRTLRFLKAYRLAAQGLWGDSLALHRETRDRLLEECGPESSMTLWAEDMLGGALRTHGDFAEAEAIHRASVAIRLREAQTKTVTEQRSLRYLAWAVFHQGRVAEAEELQSQVVEQDLAAFGGLSVRSAYNSRHVAAFRGKQAKWRGVSDIYSDYSEGIFAHESAEDFPLGTLPTSSGVIAAELAGDEPAVQEYVEAMLAQHKESTNTWAATRIALACFALPDQRLSDSQKARVSTIARRLVTKPTKTPEELLLSGLAAYRESLLVEAASNLEHLVDNPDHALASLAGYIRAMALFRLGEVDAARSCLQVAHRHLERGLRPGLLGHRGQDDSSNDLRWADYGRSLIVRNEAEILISGRVTSPAVTSYTLMERRAEWLPTQELLDVMEQQGRGRDWQRAHSALAQAMDRGPINWEPEGNFVPNLLWKALCLCALVGDEERYVAILQEVMAPAQTTQSEYCLAALLALDDPALNDKHLKMALYEVGRLQEGTRSQQRKLWALLKLGIAESRAGRFDNASAALETASEAFDLRCSGAAHAHAAITAHRSGDDTAAAEHLEKAEALYQRLLNDNPEHLGQDWNRFAVLEIALREARTALALTRDRSE